MICGDNFLPIKKEKYLKRLKKYENTDPVTTEIP